MENLRSVPTQDLTEKEVASLRGLFAAAWPDPDDAFTEDDWDHSMGGRHFLIEADGHIASHASVVERELHTSGYELATGYVEAVATFPAYERRGFATAIMKEVATFIEGTFQLGALGSGLHAFYQRRGWLIWQGSTFVRTDEGVVATPEDDGFVFVRLTPATPPLDILQPISCEWRAGDVW